MVSKGYTATDFWAHIGQVVQNAAYYTTGQRMFVDSVSAGLVRLKDLNGGPGGVAPYLGIEQLVPDQEVWVEPVAIRMADGHISQLLSWVVVGPVRRTAPTVKTIDGTILKLVGGMDLVLTSDAAGSSTVFSVDGATGNVVAGSLNTPIVTVNSQSTPDSSSTSSTTVYSSAMSTDVTLPVGTWTIKAIGFLAIQHSAGLVSNLVLDIDGLPGTARAITAPSTGFRMATDDATLSAIVGPTTSTVRVMFKSSGVGTTTVNNPGVIILATRTS